MENTKTEHWNTPQNHREENKKVVAGILAILLGYLGIHKFYLGYTKEGVIQILLNVFFGIGGVIGIIEGIIYLTKSDEDFYNTYQRNQRGWF
ncbi:TM2 domain-containing protein [Flavobacterium procerum]|uniref:TM2 domain-containing protein n=1 Tax=Flavobacterium procerum TaxID=1455569 RepID=A0ABV6BLD2_9FLAO